MKFTSRILAAVLMTVAFIELAPPALAQVTPTTTVPIFGSNVIAFVNTSSNLIAAQKYTNTVKQGQHFCVAPQFSGGSSTNSGTFAIAFALGYSNGTMVTTTTPIVARSTANGTTIVRDWIVINATNIGNADYIITTAVTNAVADASGSSIVVSNCLGQWRSP